MWQLTWLTTKTKVDSSTCRPTRGQAAVYGICTKLLNLLPLVDPVCQEPWVTRIYALLSVKRYRASLSAKIHIETVVFQLFKRALFAFTVYANLEACQEMSWPNMVGCSVKRMVNCTIVRLIELFCLCSYCALQTSRKADFDRPYQKPVNLAFINHNNLCVEQLERVF